MTSASINPTTGKTLRNYSPLTPEQMENALQKSEATFELYAQTTFDQRKQ